VLEPNAAERVERDASGFQRGMVEGLERFLKVTAGIEKLVSRNGLVAVEEGLAGEEDV
jgi:hypothetical protein